MAHRIRAAGLLVEHSRILLVGEGIMPSGERYFIPPGGGLELTDYSLVECLQREFWEEIGIRIEVDDLIYVKEFTSIETQTHHVELFFRVRRKPGSNEYNPDFDRPHQWFTREDLQTLIVFPPQLKDGTWSDTPQQAACVYLGRTAG